MTWGTEHLITGVEDFIPNLFKRSRDRKEITMVLNRLLHWVRVAVMFLSGGFIFPHAMTEDIDIAKHDADKDAKVKKQ